MISVFCSHPSDSTAHSTLKMHLDNDGKPEEKTMRKHNNDASRVNQAHTHTHSVRERANCAENICRNVRTELTHTHYLSPTITGNMIFAWLNGLFHAH